MRVVFLEDVAGVAEGGDVKEVKNGFARNYLIPQRLATPVTRESMQRVGRLKQVAEVTRFKTLDDMKALGEELDGARINVEMRAGASGRLYGSVTSAIVADEIARLTERDIDRRTVEISEPIRQLGTHDVRVRLHPEVEATISLLVYPLGREPEEYLATLQHQEEGEEGAEEGAAETDEQAEAALDPEAEDATEQADAPPEDESDTGDVGEAEAEDATEQADADLDPGEAATGDGEAEAEAATEQVEAALDPEEAATGDGGEAEAEDATEQADADLDPEEEATGDGEAEAEAATEQAEAALDPEEAATGNVGEAEAEDATE